jgi:hypothetical protein
VSAFCPPGHLPTPEAIALALKHWFPETTQEDPGSGIDTLARDRTVNQLRTLLYQGKLQAYFFGHDFLYRGIHTVERDFWASPDADGVLEEGRHFPLGRPEHRDEGPAFMRFLSRPSYLLFVKHDELDALLGEQPIGRQRQADSLPKIKRKQQPPPTGRKRVKSAMHRSRRNKYDWKAAENEMRDYAHQNGVPSTNVELVVHIEEWFANKDQHPPDSLVRQHVSKFLNSLKKQT